MTVVNPIDGIVYGFRIMGYFIAVIIAGAVVLGVGNIGFDTASVPGGLLSLIGFLIIQAGTFGILYKVIADGVAAGMESAGDV